MQRVLVIENEARISELLAKELQRVDMCVEVGWGVGVVARTLSGTYEVIVFGPKRADSATIGILAFLRAAQPKAQILVFSRLDEDDENEFRKGAEKAGADDIVLKPAGNSEFLETIVRALAARAKCLAEVHNHSDNETNRHAVYA